MKTLKCILFLIFLCGCYASADSMVLEKGMTYNLKISEVTRGQKTYLVFSGLCGHSAYAVKRIDIADEKSSKWVRVFITTNTSGLRGDFVFEIEKTPNILSVIYGDKKEVIWKPFM